MKGIRIFLLGATMFSGLTLAEVSTTCTANCVTTSQVGNSLVFTLLDINGKSVKAISTELPEGAKFLNVSSGQTVPQASKIRNFTQSENAVYNEPGSTFDSVIDNLQYETETHFITISIIGTYTYNNEGIMVLLNVWSNTTKTKKDKDREQEGK